MFIIVENVAYKRFVCDRSYKEYYCSIFVNKILFELLSTFW